MSLMINNDEIPILFKFLNTINEDDINMIIIVIYMNINDININEIITYY